MPGPYPPQLYAPQLYPVPLYPGDARPPIHHAAGAAHSAPGQLPPSSIGG